MKITRRYGTPPAQRCTPDNVGCPDILGLDSGHYLVIGKVPSTRAGITAKELMKHAAGIGIDEQAVVVPGDVVKAATRDILASALTKTERAMLIFALREAQEIIWSRGGFTDEEQEALDSLRKLADGPDKETP